MSNKQDNKRFEEHLAKRDVNKIYAAAKRRSEELKKGQNNQSRTAGNQK